LNYARKKQGKDGKGFQHHYIVPYATAGSKAALTAMNKNHHVYNAESIETIDEAIDREVELSVLTPGDAGRLRHKLESAYNYKRPGDEDDEKSPLTLFYSEGKIADRVSVLAPKTESGITMNDTVLSKGFVVNIDGGIDALNIPFIPETVEPYKEEKYESFIKRDHPDLAGQLNTFVESTRKSSKSLSDERRTTSDDTRKPGHGDQAMLGGDSPDPTNPLARRALARLVESGDVNAAARISEKWRQIQDNLRSNNAQQTIDASAMYEAGKTMTRLVDNLERVSQQYAPVPDVVVFPKGERDEEPTQLARILELSDGSLLALSRDEAARINNALEVKDKECFIFGIMLGINY